MTNLRNDSSDYASAQLGFDVLLPVRSPAPWLAETLAALENQTFAPNTVIVVLHGPGPEIECLVQRSRLNINLICAPISDTLAGVLNRGLSECVSPLVARIDSDDVPLPTRFAQQANFLASHTDCALVASSAFTIDEYGNRIGVRIASASPQVLRRRLQWRNSLMHPTVMFRLDSIRKVGGYDPRAMHVEDYDLWLRVLARYTIHVMPDVLIEYRLHPNQITQQSFIPREASAVVLASRLGAARAAGRSVVAAYLRHSVWRAYHVTKTAYRRIRTKGRVVIRELGH